MLGISGIVLWPYVFVLSLQDKQMIRHEFIHVIQIRRSLRKYGKIGVIFWYVSYLLEWVKAAFNYRNNKYEVEAYDNEEDELYIPLKDPYLYHKIKQYL
jgi:hypothetical protein